MAIAQMQGNLAEAVLYARDLLHHARASDRPEIANALLSLGQLLSLNDESDEALECWEESRGISEQLGDEVGLAWIQRAEGELRFWQGDHARAEQLFLQAIAALVPLGDRKLIAVCQLAIARIAALRSDQDMALVFLSEAIAELSKGTVDFDTLEAVKTGALVCTLVLNQPAIAIDLYSAAERWSFATGIEQTPQSAALNREIRQRAASQAGTALQIESAPLSLRAAIELLQTTLRTPIGLFDRTAILAFETDCYPAG